MDSKRRQDMSGTDTTTPKKLKLNSFPFKSPIRECDRFIPLSPDGPLRSPSKNNSISLAIGNALQSYGLSGGISLTERFEFESSARKTPVKRGDSSSGSNNASRRSDDHLNSNQSNAGNQIYNDVIINETIPSLSRLSNPQHSTSSSKKRLFCFNTTSAQHHLNEGVSPIQSKINSQILSASVISTSSQIALRQPKKETRFISKAPYKVLDAPELSDDFYLNLLDWSSTNYLGVGLASCVYLWSANTSRVFKLMDLAPQGDRITSVNWSQSAQHIAVGTHSGIVQVWDPESSKCVRKYKAHKMRVGTMAWNQNLLTTGGRDRNIFNWDMRSPGDSPVARISAHKQEVCGLKWNPEEKFLASGGNDNKLLIWDIRQMSNEGGCKPLHILAEHTAAVKAITWSPHQNGYLASGGGTADRCIKFWNVVSGNPTKSTHSVDTGSQVCNLAWSKNSNEIVSTHGYSQNQIIVWKVSTMAPLVTLTGHTLRVLYLAMSPDGQHVVTGAGDETLRFWTLFNKGGPSNNRDGGNGSMPSIR